MVNRIFFRSKPVWILQLIIQKYGYSNSFFSLLFSRDDLEFWILPGLDALGRWAGWFFPPFILFFLPLLTVQPVYEKQFAFCIEINYNTLSALRIEMHIAVRACAVTGVPNR